MKEIGIRMPGKALEWKHRIIFVMKVSFMKIKNPVKVK